MTKLGKFSLINNSIEIEGDNDEISRLKKQAEDNPFKLKNSSKKPCDSWIESTVNKLVEAYKNYKADVGSKTNSEKYTQNDQDVYSEFK